MHREPLRGSGRRISELLALCCALLCYACNEPPDPRRTNFEIRGKDGVAKYDPKTGRLSRLDIDHNKDGRIETFSYWDGPSVLRIEIDSDGDGRIDRWEHYGEGNRLERVGSSRVDDGTEDTWTYPDAAGNLARVDTDTDRDGIVDKRETFSVPPGSRAAVLSRVDLDVDADGHPRRRLHYAADGSLLKADVLR